MKQYDPAWVEYPGYSYLSIHIKSLLDKLFYANEPLYYFTYIQQKQGIHFEEKRIGKTR